MVNSPVIVDARVVTGTGGGPDKTILNSPRFLPGYRNVCAYMHPPNDPGFEELRHKAALGRAARLDSRSRPVGPPSLLTHARPLPPRTRRHLAWT